MRRGLFRAMLLAGLVALLAASWPLAAGETRTALIVSDIHFDPFAGGVSPAQLADADVGAWNRLLAPDMLGAPSRVGHDTNAPLLRSALAAVAARAASADLLIVPGDLIAHRFEAKAALALEADATSPPVRGFAVKTALFVLDGLREAAAGRPVVVGLGNNDSSCGDYRLEAHGPFLAALRDTVRAMAGASLVAADFDATFSAAGYYRMRHPTADGIDIVVVNDVLWSKDYRDRCGTRGAEAAAAMLDWLETTLDGIRAAGRHVWLVHHIPVGIDAFTSLHRRARSCAAKVTPFLKEPYAARFVDLIRRYGDEIELMISGHTHHDSYRLVRAGGRPAAVDKITPAISPIYGNNPGFQVLAFGAGGRPYDIETWALRLDAPAAAKLAWHREGSFTQTFQKPAFTEAAVAALSAELLSAGPAERPIRQAFARAYSVGHDALAGRAFRAHACAVGAIDRAAYATCFCGR